MKEKYRHFLQNNLQKILSTVALFSALSIGTLPVYAASELIISEYIEGSSYNKAIEIYNDTQQTVDLSNYELQYYFNGGTTPGRTITLSGMLANDDVYVAAEDAAVPALRDLADMLDTSTSWFNGDDAVVLLKNGVMIDVIGQIGFDPGSKWGGGDTTTQNNTIRRVVCEADINPFDVFNPALQWQGYPQDTFDGIGSHTCNIEPPTLPGEKFIHDIQGDTTSSPLAGQSVIIEAIVIADFQNNNELSGFFVQEEDADNDSDPLTSEGLFIYDGGIGIDVNKGDLVRVTGTVTEYFELTELTNVTVEIISSSNPLPTMTNVDLPMSATDYLERYEGMLIFLPQTLTVTENYNLGRYGEIWLSSGGRLMTPTAVAVPGIDAIVQQTANDLNRILLDDFSGIQNPPSIIYPAPQLTAFNTLRSGDAVTGITGALSYGFGSYRIQPIESPGFVMENFRTIEPQIIAGRLKVASFNVLNYFNGDGNGGGFPTSRGAGTLQEFDRQRDKIILAIIAMQADIIGLMEIENDGYGTQSAIADLVNGLNVAAVSGTSYTYINPGVSKIGSDEIAVGIIYRNETVQPVGGAAILDSTVDSLFIDTKNRPALAQTFEELASGALLTIAVNHLKSKGSTCDSLGDPDIGDGQGNCNLTRTAAAQSLVNWLVTDPTASNDNDFLIIGDLNAYAMEDPVNVIKNSGYSDLIDTYIGANSAYSYVFMGQSGYLDHALSSSSLATQVKGITVWHINADEPHVLDYNVEYKSLDQIMTLYNADPYRSSDHDPVIIGLDLSPPPAQKIHVTDLDASIRRLDKAQSESKVTIYVEDELGSAVENVTVSGSWSGKGVLQFSNCITDSEGICSVSIITRLIELPRVYSIDSLSHENLIYDSTSNSDADGDSDGTSIEVNKAKNIALFSWLSNILSRIFT